MYYVGIDIAKLNHFASVVSSDGEVLVKPFKFTNDNDGFCTLLSARASYDRSSLIIGLESTAHYADNLVEFLVFKRYHVCVINTIQASTMRKNNIRKTKTDKVDTLVIPGIGYINGGMILGEIGDIHRFSKPCQLLAFAGLDPSVYQSGNFNASHTKMSKRGSRILLYALINAAHNVVKNNNTFKAYYDAKMAEGRNHYNALGHCAGKLVRILFKMLTDDVAFNLE